MNKYAAQTMAKALMNEHLPYGWTFKFDNAKRRFGSCRCGSKIITLSLPVTELNDEAEVRNTILHEIAHGLAGAHHGHDLVWKSYCLRVGARPVTCAGSEVTTPKPKYSAPCPGCGKHIGRYRLRAGEQVKIACGDCCRKHNGGRFSERFAVTLTSRSGSWAMA